MRSVFNSAATVILSVFILTAAAESVVQMAVKEVSGGEDHTLVLGQNGQAFSCGDNTAQNYTFGVLGTGDDANSYELRLVAVHGSNDVGYLNDICDVDAGWMHSIALDVNGMVWAWGGGAHFSAFELYKVPDIR